MASLREKFSVRLDVSDVEEVASSLISIESHRAASGRERPWARKIASIFRGWGMEARSEDTEHLVRNGPAADRCVPQVDRRIPYQQLCAYLDCSVRSRGPCGGAFPKRIRARGGAPDGYLGLCPARGVPRGL